MFDLIDNQITISPSALNIPEFKKIWDRDKKKNKLDAHSELCYIYYMCDYKSEYRNYPESQREKKIKADFITNRMGEDWEPDQDIIKAIIKYKELQETPSLRFLKSQQRLIDVITDYMNSIESVDFKDDEKLLATLTQSQERCNKIISSLPKLKESVSKEVSETAHLRGGGQIGYMEE